MKTIDIKKLLRSIKYEVKELHPLLHQLWENIPEIKTVNYTHGTHEMGADFILTRDDLILSREQNIGVVAKIGAIKQDHAEVNRRIEECEVPRLTSGGVSFPVKWTPQK